MFKSLSLILNRDPEVFINNLSIAKTGDRTGNNMKIVISNVRSPRKYTQMRVLNLCDDRGIIWARVYVREGSISIDHLSGIGLSVRERGGLGDYDLDKEFHRGWGQRHECPKCQEGDEVYDPRDYKVKCKKCGEVY